MTITHIKIYGERNSGTHLLNQCIKRNTINIQLCKDINTRYGDIWKHAFAQKTTSPDNTTLYIFIVRRLEQWLSSMYRRPYHIINKYDDINDFIIHKLEYNINSKDTFHDLHNPKEQNKNLFEIRYSKIKHFFEFTKTISHYLIVSLDYLQQTPNNQIFLLNTLRTNYNIKLKKRLIPILKHTKLNTKCMVDPKNIIMLTQIQKSIIDKYKDKKIENFIDTLDILVSSNKKDNRLVQYLTNDFNRAPINLDKCDIYIMYHPSCYPSELKFSTPRPIHTSWTLVPTVDMLRRMKYHIYSIHSFQHEVKSMSYFPLDKWDFRNKTDKQFQNIHLTMHPYHAVPCIIQENTDRQSFQYRRIIIYIEYGVDISKYDKTSSALLSFYYWNLLIESQKPTMFIHIEELQNENNILKLNKQMNDIHIYLVKYTKPSTINISWESVSKQLVNKLDEWCKRFQYIPLSEILKSKQIQLKDN